MTTTPLRIISRALSKSGVLGVGQTASAEDTNDAFDDLNDMLAQWRRQRWLVYHLVDVSLTSTGAVSYTIGTGGDFNVTRPDRIEAAFFRQLVTSAPNQIDYPLGLIQAREDYNAIRLKQLQSFPQYVFYDAAYPTGVVYVWPVPQASIYSIHLTLKEDLPAFTSLSQPISLPAEYNFALVWSLAARLRPGYQLPPDPSVTAFATSALNIIRGANTQIPRLGMPAGLSRSRRYDVFTDRPY